MVRPLELALLECHEPVVDDRGLALAQELAGQPRLDREQAVQAGQVARDLPAHDVAPEGEGVQLETVDGLVALFDNPDAPFAPCTLGLR